MEELVKIFKEKLKENGFNDILSNFLASQFAQGLAILTECNKMTDLNIKVTLE